MPALLHYYSSRNCSSSKDSLRFTTVYNMFLPLFLEGNYIISFIPWLF